MHPVGRTQLVRRYCGRFGKNRSDAVTLLFTITSFEFWDHSKNAKLLDLVLPAPPRRLSGLRRQDRLKLTVKSQTASNQVACPICYNFDMARTCRVCGHEERRAIEKAIRAGTSLRDIERRFQVSRSSVDRHKRECMTRGAATASSNAKSQRTLTVKQERLADGVAAGLSRAEAARRAGYSARSARSIASEALAKPDVQARIAARIAESGVDPKEVVGTLVSHMRADMADFFSGDSLPEVIRIASETCS